MNRTINDVPLRTDWRGLAAELPAIHTPRACYWKVLSTGGIGPANVYRQGFLVLDPRDVATLRRQYDWYLLTNDDAHCQRMMLIPKALAHLRLRWWTNEDASFSLRTSHVGYVLFDKVNGILFFVLSG